MKTRQTNETLIKDFAEIMGMVDINPTVDTHLGRVTMLDGDAHLIEEVGKDWYIQGTLDQLTDEEFNQIFTAVRHEAAKVMSYAVSK